MLRALFIVLVVAQSVACSGNRPREGTEVSSVSTELPPESYKACAGRAKGDACVLRLDEIEATGVCAVGRGKDLRLFCNGGAR
jgi:hypothetical protein